MFETSAVLYCERLQGSLLTEVHTLESEEMASAARWIYAVHCTTIRIDDPAVQVDQVSFVSRFVRVQQSCKCLFSATSFLSSVGAVSSSFSPQTKCTCWSQSPARTYNNCPSRAYMLWFFSISRNAWSSTNSVPIYQNLPYSNLSTSLSKHVLRFTLSALAD